MNQKKSNRFMPLAMALCVVVGILIGTFYANLFSGNRHNLLHIIDDQYVDTVNVNNLVEGAMPQILAELDPHSVYISAKDVQAANDELKGSFSGVGIEFTIRKDTIHVENVVKNGPADQVGIRAGDKIVSVDGKPFVGKIVTSDEASSLPLCSARIVCIAFFIDSLPFQPGQPEQNFLQHRCVQFVIDVLALPRVADQVRLLEHRQVPGDGRRRHREMGPDLPRREPPAPQQVEYLPADGVGQGPHGQL